MNKFFVFAFFLIGCGPQIEILPPNERQYNLCCGDQYKLIDCTVASDDEIRACIACIDEVEQHKRGILSCKN